MSWLDDIKRKRAKAQKAADARSEAWIHEREREKKARDEKEAAILSEFRRLSPMVESLLSDLGNMWYGDRFHIEHYETSYAWVLRTLGEEPMALVIVDLESVKSWGSTHFRFLVKGKVQKSTNTVSREELIRVLRHVAKVGHIEPPIGTDHVGTG
jgi:hypothetical protein